MGDRIRFYNDINDNASVFPVFSLLELISYDKAENLDETGYYGGNCFDRLGGLGFVKTNQEKSPHSGRSGGAGSGSTEDQP